MEDILNSISSETGLIGLICSMFATIIWRLIRSKEFRKFCLQGIKNLFRHLFANEVFTHYFFSSTKVYLRVANTITFENSCNKKNKLFRALIITKIMVAREKNREWVVDNIKRINKLNVLELQAEFYDLVNNTIKAYEEAIKEEFFKVLEDRKEANKMFKIIYYGNGKEDLGFKDYHSKNVKHIHDFIEHLPTYVGMDNKWMLSSLLNELDTALRTSIRDVKEVFENKNGRLCK